MSRQQRSIGVLLALSLLFIGAAVVSIRAAEQKTAAGTQTTSTSAQGSTGTPATPAQPASGAPAPAAGGHQSASAPQVPEEGATIRDDPTVAPDPQESADNNVSFPADI